MYPKPYTLTNVMDLTNHPKKFPLHKKTIDRILTYLEGRKESLTLEIQKMEACYWTDDATYNQTAHGKLVGAIREIEAAIIHVNQYPSV